MGMLLITIGIKLGGNLGSFFHIASFLIVIGGGASAMCVGYRSETVRSAFSMIKACYMAPKEYNFMKLISNILLTASTARKEGILALDSKLAEIEDPFFARGLQMVVDGVDVKVIEEVLMTEIQARANRHIEVKSAVDFFASVVPAFGMIGTIIGLVGLLGALDDPSAIGPNMAVALITTFYGSVAANLLVIPYGKKIEQRSQDEELYGIITARGCMSIAAGMHPRIIQERLLAFLSENSRAQFKDLYLSEELGENA